MPDPSHRLRRALWVPAVLVLLVGAGFVAFHAGPVREASRDTMLTGFLHRRAAAVLTRDKAAFLADVDPGRDGLVAAESRLFDNLAALPFAAFSYEPRSGDYPISDSALRSRYPLGLRAVAVTLSYQIAGIDAAPTGTWYLPILGRTADRWLLVGETPRGAGTPPTYGAQPWEGEAIAVRATPHAVLVYSPSDQATIDGWAALVEDSVAVVRKVRPDQWSGKVLVVAVRDRNLIAEFQPGPSPVAALAIRRHAEPESVDRRTEGTFSGTLVLLDPAALDAAPADLASTVTHEFTHAAMNPVTGPGTPTWLIEGFAEYVAWGSARLDPAWARAHLATADLTELPYDRRFYERTENYPLAMLACQLVAERYGEAKLVALYEWYQSRSDRDLGVRSVLGVPLAELTAQWQAHVHELAG